VSEGFRFCLIRSGVVVRECRAGDAREAAALLKPQRDDYVTSALSYEAGWPKPIPAAMCRSCGQRPRLGPKTPRCAVCEPRIHEAHQRDSVARRSA
jgi:hypothetical protein